MTEQYLDVHNKKLSIKSFIGGKTGQDVKDSKLTGSEELRDFILAANCLSKASTSGSKLSGRFRLSYYYKRGLTKHEVKRDARVTKNTREEN